MKRATSLFIIVLIAVGALLFLSGPLIDRRPHAELCNAAYALVKRQALDDAVRREGHCLVTGSGALHTVRWAYSTATSRETEAPPIAYEAKVAFDGKTYHLCSLRFPGTEAGILPSPALRRQAQAEHALSDTNVKAVKDREDSHSPRIFRQPTSPGKDNCR